MTKTKKERLDASETPEQMAGLVEVPALVAGRLRTIIT